MKRNGMKMRFCGIVVLLFALATACFAGAEGDAVMYYSPHAGSRVAAVFAAADIQPYMGEDGEEDRLDSVWVYYTDGTFEQFAEADDKVVLFSEGTYTLGEGSSFVYEKNGETPDRITVRRTKKYRSGSLTPYESSHEYELGTLGLVRISAIDE